MTRSTVVGGDSTGLLQGDVAKVIASGLVASRTLSNWKTELVSSRKAQQEPFSLFSLEMTTEVTDRWVAGAA